jgi:hypothetical protein
MVHKASHYSDLINWWLSAVPVTVFSFFTSTQKTKTAT